MRVTKPSLIHARQSVEPRMLHTPSSFPAYTKLLYTPEQAADLLSMSRSRIYVLMAQAVIASIKEGRCRLIPAAALDAYLQRRLTEQAPSYSTVEPVKHLSVLGRQA
jgi:excisionase family DNA binding protein